MEDEIMFENKDKFKTVKRIVICVCVFWITMFLTGMMISVNEHMERNKGGRDKSQQYSMKE